MPGPGERLVPIEGSETVRDPRERARWVIEHWRSPEGEAYLRWHGAELEGESVRILVDADGLAALDDHDYELLILALSGALHAVHPFRSLHLTGVDDEGFRHPEEVLRPRISPYPDESVRPWRPEDGLLGGLLPIRQGSGALAGRRIALSPGHGATWSGSAWITQRSDSFGLLEDFLTATISHHHIDPYLQAHGGDVVWMRDRTFSTLPPQIRNDSGAGYTESGNFSDGSSPGGYGGAYRFATAGTPANVARWDAAHTGRQVPVFAWWVHGTNRASAARYLLGDPSLGFVVERDQQRGGPHWHYLGTVPLSEGGEIQLQGVEGSAGVMMADALRFGSLTGAIRRNGNPSGRAGWQENSRNYAEFSGAPAAVYAARATERDSDIVARPLWANRLMVDAFVSVHTNAAGGTGTETFIHNTSPTAGSAALSAAVHQRLVQEIRDYWNPSWTDRGQKTANFGELRELNNAPGILVEIAFHDRNPATGPDVPSLHDPRFRRIAGRAIARGVVRMFNAQAPFVPEPPQDLLLRNVADGLELSWQDQGAREGASPATSYRVFVARGEGPFDAGTAVQSSPWRVPNVAAGEVVHVRVAGVNAGGTGLAGRVVSARRSTRGQADLLLVDGYRRWDRSTAEEGNDPRQATRAALALAQARTAAGDGWSFDGATRERFVALDLAPWDAVVWLAGRDQPSEWPLTNGERDALRALVNSGGALLLTGTHAPSLLRSADASWAANFVEGTPTTVSVPEGLEGGGTLATTSTLDHFALVEVDQWIETTSAAGRLAWSRGDTAAAWWTGASRVAVSTAPLEGVLQPTARASFAASLLQGVGVLPDDDTHDPDPIADPDPVADPDSDIREDTDIRDDADVRDDSDTQVGGDVDEDSTVEPDAPVDPDVEEVSSPDDTGSGGEPTPDVGEDPPGARPSPRGPASPAVRSSYAEAGDDGAATAGCAVVGPRARPASIFWWLLVLVVLRRRYNLRSITVATACPKPMQRVARP